MNLQATRPREIAIPSDSRHRRDRLLRFPQKSAKFRMRLRQLSGARALGVLAAVTLHLLVLCAFLWGPKYTAPRDDSATDNAGIATMESNAEPGLTMILTEFPTPSEQPFLPLTLDNYYQGSDAGTAVTAEQEAMHARQRAMYLGQIKARIDRAWTRPRTAIGATRFHCRVQIAQNPQGDVTEVALRPCNGDARWQLSLVAAIQSASPLPAPPDPSVFTGQLVLNFETVAYQPGGTEQGFERELAPQLATADPSFTAQ